jgi:hypothetical protein
MGIAMAGMLLPQLSPLPSRAWEAVFVAAAAWFAYQTGRTLRRSAASPWRCPHPVPHLIECAAMLYMRAPLPGSWPSWPGQAVPMAGMGGGRPAARGSLGALAMILALFMIGYVHWTADQLTALWHATAVVASGAMRNEARTPMAAGAPSSARDTHNPAADAASAGHAHRAGSPELAPRLAACYKIAMGITLGYMLILML